MAPKKQQQGIESLHTIEGQLNEEFLSWLPNSLVCTSPEPRDAASLESAICTGYGQCQKMYTLSGCKFILTYQSAAERDEALRNHKELDQWFSDIKIWDKYEACSTRMVWLEIIGVPPQGWTWETFKKIANLWGYLICLGKPIIRTKAFDNIRILIQTDILACIEADIVLRIEELGFRVYVREICCSGFIQKAKCATSRTKDANESNKNVPGFEDLDSHIEAAHHMFNSGCINHNQVLDDQQKYGTNSISAEKRISNSNSAKEIEESQQEVQSAQINSDTRTKTAHFSAHECSGEVEYLTNSNHKVPLQAKEILENAKGARKFNDDEEAAQQPPGFESRLNIGNCHNAETLIEGQSETQANSQGENPIAPPGFELLAEDINAKTFEPN